MTRKLSDKPANATAKVQVMTPPPTATTSDESKPPHPEVSAAIGKMVAAALAQVVAEHTPTMHDNTNAVESKATADVKRPKITAQSVSMNLLQEYQKQLVKLAEKSTLDKNNLIHLADGVANAITEYNASPKTEDDQKRFVRTYNQRLLNNKVQGLIKKLKDSNVGKEKEIYELLTRIHDMVKRSVTIEHNLTEKPNAEKPAAPVTQTARASIKTTSRLKRQPHQLARSRPVTKGEQENLAKGIVTTAVNTTLTKQPKTVTPAKPTPVLPESPEPLIRTQSFTDAKKPAEPSSLPRVKFAPSMFDTAGAPRPILESILRVMKAHDYKLHGGGTKLEGCGDRKFSRSAGKLIPLIQAVIDKEKPEAEDYNKIFETIHTELKDKIKPTWSLFWFGAREKSTADLYVKVLEMAKAFSPVASPTTPGSKE